jgi:hypothetical protein
VKRNPVGRPREVNVVRDEAIFINGIYLGVLDEILAVQEYLPDQILYLQPYKSEAMRHLSKNPPSVEDPVQLLASTTDRLGEVGFVGDIVGWDDKRDIEDYRWRAISRVVWALQPNEGGVYPGPPEKLCVNLLHVRRLRRLEQSIPVTQLVKTVDQQPIAGERSTAGGWTYVRKIDL